MKIQWTAFLVLIVVLALSIPGLAREDGSMDGNKRT